MDEGSQRTGYYVSGAMHMALLAIVVLGFARAPRFEDAPESVPVETISTTQLNEIMEGEKTSKPAPPKPAPPAPPKPAAPPPPPEPPEPPQPPQPPPKPAPPPPPAPPPKPAPPAPPPRPEPPKPQAEDAPSPPIRPREKPEETPRPPDRPRPPKADTAAKPDKFKPDEIAKALAKEPPDDKPRHNAPTYDSSAIAKMLNQTKTAEAEPGLANHHATRMSVSLENALNEWFRDSYKNCWNLPPSNPQGDNYVFDVRVTFNPDGSLAARPVMLNPPHDPGWRAHADSVMRAVMRCNPLHVPTQYAPFFDQWRSKIVHFDPSSAEG